MEEKVYLVQVLTDQDKSFLRSKTPASLPDNPSDKRFSASQVKGKHYEGYLILFEWLKKLETEVNVVATNLLGDVTELQEVVGGRNFISIEEEDYVIPVGAE